MMTDMVNDRKEINEAIVAGDMALNSLYEAQEKLNRVQPENIGQASRISGVSPADVSVLIIWLASKKE